MTRKQSKLLTTFLTLLIAALLSIQQGGLSLLHLPQLPSVASTYGTSSYPVVHVVDGDTVDIERRGVKERVRLIGINSPESVDPRRSVECFGKEASKYARSILAGQRVTVATDPTQAIKDKYGRRLFYVYLPDGRSFNELMIREGYAYEYTYHTPYRYQQEYKAAERDAQANMRGLWASTTCNGFK